MQEYDVKAPVQEPEFDPDIKRLEADEVQSTIVELPRAYCIRAGEFQPGWEYGAGYLWTESDRDVERFKYCLEIGKVLFLNLLRMDSGLKPTAKPVEEWPASDLIEGKWGNDYTPSAKKSISARPGWTYRIVSANWPLISRRLVFWNPEGHLETDPKRTELIERSTRRADALKFIEETKSLYEKEKASRPKPESEDEEGEAPSPLKEAIAAKKSKGRRKVSQS